MAATDGLKEFWDVTVEGLDNLVCPATTILAVVATMVGIVVVRADAGKQIVVVSSSCNGTGVKG